ncbi:MAG: hypothetical protein ACRD2G_01150 [Terriglobia bacterium]
MEADESPLETFREHFKQYMNYVGAPRGGPRILKITYQFLSDSQERDLAEVVGFVRRADPPATPPAFKVIPGFRR